MNVHRRQCSEIQNGKPKNQIMFLFSHMQLKLNSVINAVCSLTLGVNATQLGVCGEVMIWAKFRGNSQWSQGETTSGPFCGSASILTKLLLGHAYGCGFCYSASIGICQYPNPDFLMYCWFQDLLHIYTKFHFGF